jgi:hypothetical protein
MLVQVRTPYRLRVDLGSAYVAGSLVPSLYAVASLDDRGDSPVVSGVMAVPGAGTFVELALATPLVETGRYRVTLTAVPTATASFSGTEDFLVSRSASLPSALPSTVTDFNRVLYGADLLVSGGDFVEGPDGDLAELAGAENMRQAVTRRLMSAGLPYDPEYGAKPREYVDAPTLAAGALSGRLTSQAVADPRVTKATADLVVKDGDVSFDVQITPLADPAATYSVPVPVR